MKHAAKSKKRKTTKKTPSGERALSIRQPWAWLIVNRYKDVENRVWQTQVRGRILIHAGAKPVTKSGYDEFLQVCRQRRIKNYPDRDEFDLGGIVGSVDLVDCVDDSRSYWFFGPFGFVLKNARRSRFHKVKGMLGFFRVRVKKGR